MDIPIILRISSGSLSTPNNPRSSITYATINCDITTKCAFAGPSDHTLNHSPCDPAPTRLQVIHIWVPLSTMRQQNLFRQISHATAHSRNALNCTQPLLTHIPVVFVTCVLNTPCTLISAPDKSAQKTSHLHTSCLCR